MKQEVRTYADGGTLAQAAADLIAGILNDTLSAGKTASLVLSGGRTPAETYERLAAGPRVDWSRVDLFWSDERPVGPESSLSNFRLADDTLLRRVEAPPSRIHRIRGEWDPATAAWSYEEEIRAVMNLPEGEFPRFTLCLLGLGADGHTASLFPGTSALLEKERIAADLFVEKLGGHRITLTLPAINHAENILFLVTGRSKAGVLRDILGGVPLHYPAGQVAPVTGQLFWLLDSEASSLLKKEHIP